MAGRKWRLKHGSPFILIQIHSIECLKYREIHYNIGQQKWGLTD